MKRSRLIRLTCFGILLAPLLFVSMAGAERKFARDKKGWIVSVRSAAISHDGKYAALAYDGTDKDPCFLRIWDISNGEALANLEGHTARIHFCAFTPENHLVTASSIGTVIVYKLTMKKKALAVETLKAFVANGNLYYCAISPNGKYLITRGFDAGQTTVQTKVWDLDKARLVQTLEDSAVDGSANAIAISSDGRLALTFCRTILEGDKKGATCLWDVAKNKKILTLHKKDNWDDRFGFSDDGKGFIVSKWRETEQTASELTYCDLATLRQKKTIKFGTEVGNGTVVHFRQVPGTQMWFGVPHLRKNPDPPQYVGFWEFDTMKAGKVIPLDNGRFGKDKYRVPVTVFAIAPTGQYALVATGANDRDRDRPPLDIHVWNLKTGQLLHSWRDTTPTQ